ncbi:MAG: AsnC family transcriptional regulator [Gammaproteobacteria bacterium]
MNTASEANRGPANRPEPALDALERRLLNEFQRDFPLSRRPYAQIGRRLGIPEQEVIEHLANLQSRGLVSRIGPVFRCHRAGTSTLAAMAVPAQNLAAVAKLVNQYPEVNHNYEREHHFNLWFVATAPDARRLGETLDEIVALTGIEVLDLPLERAYHIDLGFPLW